MKILQWMSAALALASPAACSSTSGTSHAPGDSDGNVVSVTTGIPPALLAFRDDLSTDWVGLPVHGATTFDLTTHGAYQVVIACSAGDQDPSVTMILYGRTADDDPTIKLSCGGGFPFQVKGEAFEAGEVSLGDSSEGASFTDWQFDLVAQPGTFDLVMVSRSSTGVPSSIAFRRDLAIVNDTDLGAISLSQGSQPLVPVSYTIANLQAGESATSSLLLTAGNTEAFVGSLGGSPQGLTAQLVPDAALRPTDRQHLTLAAATTDATTSLSHSRALGRDVQVGDSTVWTLPDPIGGVTFDVTADRMTATWSSLPEYDEIELLREGFTTDFGPPVTTQVRLHELVLSRAFAEATGATSATLDFHAIPGFKSQWQQDPTVSQFRTLEAIRHVSATETASATVDTFASASTARNQPRVKPGTGRATWLAPGLPDRWQTIPLGSPDQPGRAGRL